MHTRVVYFLVYFKFVVYRRREGDSSCRNHCKRRGRFVYSLPHIVTNEISKESKGFWSLSIYSFVIISCYLYYIVSFVNLITTKKKEEKKSLEKSHDRV